jgi:PRTRC genetic system protein C
MISSTILPRVFIHTVNNAPIRLSDPSEKFSAEEVRNFYANTYPILTTATIEGPQIEDDEIRYYFRADLGTKG